MLRLIINADDLGLTPGCNQGIVRAMTQGVVSDTTLMINTAYAPAAVELLKAHGIRRAGLHLNLTYGAPVLPAAVVPSLVDADGLFHRKIAQAAPGFSPGDVAVELKAQAEQFLATGLDLTHLDSHHHAHSYPEVIDTVIALALELGVPLRHTGAAVRQRIAAAGVLTTDHFSPDFYDEGVSGANLRKLITAHRDGVLEIMCHPAADDDDLVFAISSYTARRADELAILTEPALRDFLKDNNIELISFADLKG